MITEQTLENQNALNSPFKIYNDIMLSWNQWLQLVNLHYNQVCTKKVTLLLLVHVHI